MSCNCAARTIEMRYTVEVGHGSFYQGDINQMIDGHMLLDVCDVPGRRFERKDTPLWPNHGRRVEGVIAGLSADIRANTSWPQVTLHQVRLCPVISSQPAAVYARSYDPSLSLKRSSHHG